MPLPTLNPGDGESAVLLAHAQAGPFLLTHKRYRHDFAQTWHEHPVASIDLVLAGAGSGVYGRTEVVSRAGAVEFFREGVRHTFRAYHGGIRSMHVMIPPEAMGDGAPEVGVRELEPTRALAPALRLLGEIAGPDASTPLAIEALVYELLGEARAGVTGARPNSTRLGQSRHGHARLDEARDLLHDFRSAPIGLGEVAAAVGIHPGHLARGFRARFGCSLGAYHRRLRLASAARRLAGTDEPIARIAQSEGFTDQAHLTRTFRAHTGTTPAAFRRALRA